MVTKTSFIAAFSSISRGITLVRRRSSSNERSARFVVRTRMRWRTGTRALFRGTVLGLEERHTPQARAVLRAFNRAGDFDNLGDSAEGLRRILEKSFETVEVDVVGSTANFTASGPRPPTTTT